MKKEEVIASFEKFLDMTMKAIFVDVRVHAEAGVIEKEESIAMINKAVDDNYTKIMEMPNGEFIAEVLHHMIACSDLAERLMDENNN